MTQDVLQAYTKTGRVQPWGVHRVATLRLSDPYEGIDPHKAKRLRSCATYVSELQFADGTIKHNTWFCRVRLCPMCNWRRSQKVGSQMNSIMEAIKADKPCAYVLLTLTVRNCSPEMLDKEITDILRAFSNMTKRKAFQRAVLGFYRAMEVTHNLVDDTYHPHIHAVLAVNPSYFKSRDYLSQDTWSEMWQQSLKADYKPIVNVKRIKGDTAAAVAEVAKYTIKPADYIIPEDWELTVNTVRILDTAFHNRRFIAYGGIFKDYHKKLHLSDVEDPADDLPDEQPISVTHYEWCATYKQYRRVDG